MATIPTTKRRGRKPTVLEDLAAANAKLASKTKRTYTVNPRCPGTSEPPARKRTRKGIKYGECAVCGGLVKMTSRGTLYSHLPKSKEEVSK